MRFEDVERNCFAVLVIKFAADAGERPRSRPELNTYSKNPVITGWGISSGQRVSFKVCKFSLANYSPDS